MRFTINVVKGPKGDHTPWGTEITGMPHTFWVDRRSPLGNPNKMSEIRKLGPNKTIKNPYEFGGEFITTDRCYAIDLYHMLLDSTLPDEKLLALRFLWKHGYEHGELNLACHCAPLACHAHLIKSWLEQWMN